MPRALVVLAVLLALPAGLARAADPPVERPEGAWFVGADDPKYIPESEIRFLGPNRLTWAMGGISGVFIRFDADYSLTKDSALYAIITKVTYGSSVDEKIKEKLPGEDDTFSFRFRIDDGEMRVRDVKGKGFDALKSAAGRYKQRPGSAKPKEDARKDKTP
jgi:hypothetical protein